MSENPFKLTALKNPYGKHADHYSFEPNEPGPAKVGPNKSYPESEPGAPVPLGQKLTPKGR